MTPVVHWVLRIGFAMCFIGHGAFGLLQKREWLGFFGAFGIGDAAGLLLMPVVGTVDIALGVAALVGAPRALFAYGAFWCLFTAALRPLVGLSAGEFFERAGNYGVPIVLLLWTARHGWFDRVRPAAMDAARIDMVRTACIVTTAVLLIGHGWLALLNKPLLAYHLATIGVDATFLPAMGAIEIGLAAAVLMRPAVPLLFAVAGWKVTTEALFLVAGAPIWEFVERGGSYAAPVAAGLLLMQRAPAVGAVRTRWSTAAMVAMVLFGGGAVSAQPPAGLSPQLIGELQSGGLVAFCRHAITSHAREDRMPVDFTDLSTQRVLSPDGEQQAIAMGDAFQQLRIRFGVSLASPFQRTRRSAESMAGHVAIDEALSSMARNRDTELRALVFGHVEAGSNRLLVTHQGMIYRVLRDLRRGAIAEGDCVIVRPAGADGEVLAHVKADDWVRAAKAQ